MKKEYSSEELQQFGKELADFLQPRLSNYEPLMIGACLMKSAIELYTRILDDPDIFSLLDHIASSVPEIREQTDAMMANRTLH